MNYYRIINFIPDPFNSARIPIGAIVENGSGVRVIPASYIPDPACLGGQARAGLVKLLLQDFCEIDSMDALPSCIGPQVILDAKHAVPSGIEDIGHWVSINVLPGKHGDRNSNIMKKLRSQRRATAGYRCFETFQVAKYVKKTFRPSEDGGGLFRAGAPILDEISHWVSNATEVMLLEPIVPEGISRHVDEDSRIVAKRFIEYKHIIEKTGSTRNDIRASLNAYLLPGIDAEHKSRALDKLGISGVEIFDLDQEKQRTRLIERIRSLGETPNQGQMPLPQ